MVLSFFCRVGKEQRNEGLKERKPKPNFDIEFRLRLSRSRIIEYGIRFRPNRISLSTRIFDRISAIFNSLAELFCFLCSWVFEGGTIRFSYLKNILFSHYGQVSHCFTLLLGLNLVLVPFCFVMSVLGLILFENSRKMYNLFIVLPF